MGPTYDVVGIGNAIDVVGIGNAYDVVGIGNAIVDLIAPASPAFLSQHGMQPGSMTLIDAAQARTLAASVGTVRESSGGSVANTCAVAAVLGSRVAFLGKVADDAWGEAFRREIAAAGVHFPTPPLTGQAPTACCLILVTPDGQRTMNTFLGACVSFDADDLDRALIERAAVTYLEGYLFDPPLAQAAFRTAAAMARSAGRLTALSLSDAFCVGRHRAAFHDLLPLADILFANEAEICSLYETDWDTAARLAARDGRLVALTRGAAGSVILHGAQSVTVAAVPTPVTDTTGAGDCYAAGFLAAHARGQDLASCGALGSRAASACIAVYGARPGADRLAALL